MTYIWLKRKSAARLLAFSPAWLVLINPSICKKKWNKKSPNYAFAYRGSQLEQATGIEPAWSAWEAEVLPLNYACRCWSWWWDLNSRPADYESAALPLCYTSINNMKVLYYICHVLSRTIRKKKEKNENHIMRFKMWISVVCADGIHLLFGKKCDIIPTHVACVHDDRMM